MGQFSVNKAISMKEQGMALKEYLIEMGISKRLLTDIKFSGGDLLIDGKSVTVRHELTAGEELTVRFPPEIVSSSLEPDPVPLTILYEDEHVLLINKQPYVSSIPSREHPTGSIANGLIHYYAAKGFESTVHLVNRLDRDTSGAMLIAKHRFAHSLLSKSQKEGKVKRSYIAVVEGIVPKDEGTIDAPIGRKGTSIIEREISESGQAAVTRFTVLKRFADTTLVALMLETGRTHQIRVHMEHYGHPLCGDSLYGGSKVKIARQALHSEWITFFHPMTQEKLTFCAPVPKDIRQLLEEQSD